MENRICVYRLQVTKLNVRYEGPTLNLPALPSFHYCIFLSLLKLVMRYSRCFHCLLLFAAVFSRQMKIFICPKKKKYATKNTTYTSKIFFSVFYQDMQHQDPRLILKQQFDLASGNVKLVT